MVVITPAVTAGPERTKGRSAGQPTGSQDQMSRVADEQHGSGRSPFDGREPVSRQSQLQVYVYNVASICLCLQYRRETYGTALRQSLDAASGYT